jgi:cyclin-A
LFLFSQKLNSASLTATVSPHDIVTEKQDIHPPKDHTVAHVPNVAHATANGSIIVSPIYSGDSISTSDAMPTCDSMKKSPDFKCIDNEDSPRLASLQLRANDHLFMTKDGDVEGLFSLLKFLLVCAC